MKKIKLLRKMLVGNAGHPFPIGWVGKVERAEADALIALGYAKETDEKESESTHVATPPSLPAGMKETHSTDPGNNLAQHLEGTVAEVAARLDALTADQLRELRTLEMASDKPRKGVIDAINEYDLDGE